VKNRGKEELHHWIFSERAWEMKSSAIRDILKITELPDVISFAGGLPAPELFPVEELKEACDRVLSDSGPRSLQYSISMGHQPLREFLAGRYRKSGIPATHENIMITAGSQQGLDLVGRAFLDSGSFVIAEDPTYLGALQAFKAYNPHYQTVSMDEEGMVISEVEDAIRKSKPRFQALWFVLNIWKGKFIRLKNQLDPDQDTVKVSAQRNVMSALIIFKRLKTFAALTLELHRTCFL